ncbi:MAG: response regulator, partial [Nitrospirales bacterium]
DDSVFMRMTLSAMVKDGGHEVVVAVNGQDGLEKIRSDQPDCLVTDLNMPEMEGQDLIAAVRAEGIPIPIIVNTADVQESTRKQCMELGATAFFNKPLKPDSVLASINEALTEKAEISTCN